MKDFRRATRGNFLRWKGITWVIRLTNGRELFLENIETGETDRLPISVWQNGCHDGEITMVADPAAELPEHVQDLANVPFSALPGTMQAAVSRMKRYVEAYEDPIRFYETHLPHRPKEQRHIPRRRSKSKVEPLLRDVAATSSPPDDPPGFTTFCGWLRKRERYRDWNLMAPRYDRRGPTERSLIRGPLKEILDDAVRRVWLNPLKLPKKDVCEEVEKLVAQYNEADPDLPSLAVSRRQICRYIDESVDRYDAAVARYGKKWADARFKPVWQGPIPDNIMDIVEVDHTQSKVAVCDDLTGEELGRPWITAALDRRSRMVAGLHVHFEGQSLHAVMQALRNTMQPKGFLRALVPDLNYDYPCCGIPVAFYFDRGDDFDNDHVREVGLNFDIVIEYAPGEQPELKGSLERFWATLHNNVALKLPGARPRIRRSADDNQRQTPATICFSDFCERLWRWITMVYASEVHSGINNTPLRRWQEGEEARSPRPPMPRDKADKYLMRTVRSKPSKEGVKHDGLRWNGDIIKTIISHPSFRKGDEILVRIDDSDYGRAFATDPVTKKLVALEPVLSHYMPGLTKAEHDQVLKEVKAIKEGKLSEAALMDAKARLRQEALGLMSGGKVKSKTRERLARLAKVGSIAPAGTDLGSLDPRSAGSILPDTPPPEPKKACRKAPSQDDVASAPPPAAPSKPPKKVSAPRMLPNRK